MLVQLASPIHSARAGAQDTRGKLGKTGPVVLSFEAGRPVRIDVPWDAISPIEALIPLFKDVRSGYAFYANHSITPTGSGFAIRNQPLALLTLAMRKTMHYPEVAAIIHAVVQHWGDKVIRIRPLTDLRKFEFDKDEQAILDLLRAEPMNLETLIALSRAPVPRVHHVVYLLSIAKCVEVFGGSQAQPSETQPSQAPPAVDRRAEIHERARAIEQEDYFQRLGMGQTANMQEIRTAYFELVKTWHPDRTPEGLDDMRPQISQVFQALTEAFQTLTNPAKRAEYLQKLSSGDAAANAEEIITNTLRAEREYQQAEVMLRKRDLENALSHIETATKLNADQAEYHILRGWIMAQLHETSPEHLQQALQSVESGLGMQPESEKGNFYKGMILKRLHKDAQALVCFKKVTKINPNHIDALREIRLAMMRGTGTSKSHGSLKAADPNASKDGKKDGKKDGNKGDLLERLFGKGKKGS